MTLEQTTALTTFVQGRDCNSIESILAVARPIWAVGMHITLREQLLPDGIRVATKAIKGTANMRDVNSEAELREWYLQSQPVCVTWNDVADDVEADKTLAAA